MNKTIGTARLDRRGFLFAIAGTLLFSMKAILIKLAFQYDVHPDVLMMLRMLFALPFFLAIGFFTLRAEKSYLSPALLLSTLLLGALGYYGANALDIYGLQYLPATLERLILFTYPTMVLLISAALFSYRLQPLLVGSVAITYGGLFIVFTNGSALEYRETSNFYLGVLLVALSALTFACFKIGSGRIMRYTSSRLFTSIAMLGASAAIGSHFFLRQDPVSLSQQANMVYVYALVLAIFCTVIPSFLVAAAVKRIGAPIASAIGSAGPVMTLLLAMLLLDERLSAVQLVGFTIVLLSIASLSRLRSQ